jgi:mRNA interferase MazF
MKRSELWWASLGEAAGSIAGFRRPILIVSIDAFNDSALRTVVGVPVTTSARRGRQPGNVRLPAKGTGLARDSFANVFLVGPYNKAVLTARIGRVSSQLMGDVEKELRLVLGM